MAETAVITVEPITGKPTGWPDLIVLENVPSRVKVALATSSPPVVFNVIKFWSGVSHPILDQVDEVTASTTATVFNYLNFTLPFTDYAYGEPYTVNSLTGLDVTVRALGGTIPSGLPSGDSTAKAYNYPSIQSATVQRCLSDGTIDDEGTYLKIDLSALVAKNPYNHYAISAKCRKVGDTTWGTLGLTDSSGALSDIAWLKDQSFSRSLVTGAGAIDGDYPYEVQITFGDDIKSVSQTFSIPTAYTTIDYRDGGKGVAFGKVATQDGFDLAMPLIVQDTAQARAALHAQQDLTQISALEIGADKTSSSNVIIDLHSTVGKDYDGRIISEPSGDLTLSALSAIGLEALGGNGWLKCENTGNTWREINALATMKVLMGSASSTGGMPNSANNWRWTNAQTVNFSSSFATTPIVLACITSTNGVTSCRVNTRNTSGFQWGAHEYGSADNTRNVTIDWIAIGT